MSKGIIRVCPYCGNSYPHLGSHIKYSHPEIVDKKILIRDYLGLSEIPKCPICGDECSTRDYSFNETCGKRTCNERNKVRKGTHGLLRANSPLNEEGKMIRVINSNKSTMINKTNSCFSPKTREGEIYSLYLMKFKECIKVGITRDLESRISRISKLYEAPVKVVYFNQEFSILKKIESLIHSGNFNHFEMPNISDGFQSIGYTEFYKIDEESRILDFINSKFNDYSIEVELEQFEMQDTER